MGFSEDILEVKKILNKQAILKPATKKLNEAGKLFKPAGKAEISQRPKPIKVLHYHVYDADDMSNATDQWTTDFVLAVKIAKKLVREGWTQVRIGEAEESGQDDSLEEEDTVWVGGESEFDGDVDYSSEQARADMEAGIDEALIEADKKALFKKAGEAEIDARMDWSNTQNSEDLRIEIERDISLASKTQLRMMDKLLRRLWLANKENAREDMVDLCVELAREAENIYYESEYKNSSWKTAIWTLKEMCYFSDAEERNFMDQIEALGL